MVETNQFQRPGLPVRAGTLEPGKPAPDPPSSLPIANEALPDSPSQKQIFLGQPPEQAKVIDHAHRAWA